MANIAGEYRFLLDGVQVYPVFGNDLSYSFEKADDSYYFRTLLDSKLQFIGADYSFINNSDISMRFELTMEKYDGSSWVLRYTGYFFKTDCEFNADDSVVDIKPLTDDGFDDIKSVLNNEYNFVDLEAATTKVSYTLRAIMQIVTVIVNGGLREKSNILTNVVEFSSWEETLDKDYTPTELLAFGFTGYAESEIFLNGLYIYRRYLTTLDLFNGEVTVDRLANDLSSISSFYNKTSIEITNDFVNAGTSAVTSKYGKAPYCGSGTLYYVNPGFYYMPINPTNAWGNTVGIAIGCDTLFLHKTTVLNEYELTNSDTKTVEDTYSLYTVLQTLLAQETDLLFEPTTDYSEFLFSTVDPVGGDAINLFFTPKSNIVNAFYTSPARKSKIRLSEVLELLGAAFSTGWHIEVVGGEKRLRIEHVSWYENGGTYADQKISIDLTTSFDVRNSKAQAYGQNKFNYRKSNMPQRYEFGWDNDTPTYFNGSPIVVLSGQISKGQIEKKETQGYSPEIASIVGRSDLSLDGWSILAAIFNDPDYMVEPVSIAISPGIYYRIVNGLLSYTNLHPKYHRYAMPALDIEINGGATTALSIIRNKQQDIVFQSSEDIDPLNLITTDLGSGQVDKMTYNILSGTYKATINLTTE